MKNKQTDFIDEPSSRLSIAPKEQNDLINFTKKDKF